MRIYKYLLAILFSSIVFTACKENYKFKLTTSNKVILNDKTSFTLVEVNGNPVDSIQFFVNGNRIISKQNSATISTTDFGVGKHSVTALAFYPEKTKKINNSIEVLSNKPYAIYTYKIINTYPHDKAAYTQGLEYHNGFLYETTGRKGKSSLRKVELKTGKVLKETYIDKKYFGEGMTIFNDKIYFLTWKAKKGFIYNLNSFKREGEFNFNKSKEGWGLTHNDTELIKSDGTNKIWFLDAKTQKEKRFISVYSDKNGIKDLNELEYVNGKIYANYWKQPLIAIINPDSGIVEGIANLTTLQKKISKAQNLDGEDEVLNGIAFDAKNNRLFVTGKHWGKLFEIELIKNP